MTRWKIHNWLYCPCRHYRLVWSVLPFVIGRCVRVKVMFTATIIRSSIDRSTFLPSSVHRETIRPGPVMVERHLSIRCSCEFACGTCLCFWLFFYVALSLSTATCCYTRRVDLLPSWISIASGHYSTRKNRPSWSKGASVCMWTIQVDPIETTGYARRLPPKELTELSGLRPKAKQISDRVHTADMYWVCHGIGHHNLQVINKITAIIASTPATALA